MFISCLQERGITLDLGFSCFTLPAPPAVSSVASEVQVTLVDCPGHASLIRTIIAGAQIIDAMMLVVDVTKGIQTQTAECLVVGEILCDHLILVLNKIDLIPKDKVKAVIDKMTKRLLATLQSTKFSTPKVIAVAARPGGSTDMMAEPTSEPLGVDELLNAIKDTIYLPKRETSGPFVFSVDHCFGIKGQGTVMTGTVLQGTISINDNVEIPSLGITKKVKSMQMFRKPVEKACQGDRLGVCVTQFDPKLLERGLACTPGLIKSAFGLLVSVTKIPYYKLEVETKSKFHISVGNETIMAKATFFGTESDEDSFDINREYPYQSHLIDLMKKDAIESNYKPCRQFAVLQFDRCIPVIPGSLIIGSKLDMDVHTSMCRLAFKGSVLDIFSSKDYPDTILSSYKVFKNKTKEGLVERKKDDSEVIIKNLLKKGTNIQLFVGLKVKLSTGEVGEIEGHFGTSGKLVVRVTGGLKAATLDRLKALEPKKKSKNVTKAMDEMTLTSKGEPIKVSLEFKKYIFAPGKKMRQ